MVPTKAAYLELETNPDIEFDYYLAEQLGMTVERLRREMSNSEYLQWNVYYARKAQRTEMARLRGGG